MTLIYLVVDYQKKKKKNRPSPISIAMTLILVLGWTTGFLAFAMSTTG
jgi:hypothetical protein